MHLNSKKEKAERVPYENFSITHIAPCGINCGTCLAYLRKKNRCTGCRSNGPYRSDYVLRCTILNCNLLAKSGSLFCHACEKYPCARLKSLDKRYRTKYRLSLLGNLEYLRQNGPEAFLQQQDDAWHCRDCGENICVHRGYCLKCGPKPAGS